MKLLHKAQFCFSQLNSGCFVNSENFYGNNKRQVANFYCAYNRVP